MINKYILQKYHCKKKCLILLSALGIILASYTGNKIGSQILKEEIRISKINTDDLNLQDIINFTDEAGTTEYQLNWKEVLAILAVQKNNYTNNISQRDILSTGNLFINKENNSIKSLESVVESLELKEKEEERVFSYLDDLKYYGFTPEKLTPDSPQMQFINSIKESCIKNYQKSNILPSITIAQAILESNWGNSNLTKEANNLFGIKADYYWKGESVIFETNEYHNNMIKDKFRKYDTLEDSINDHSEFLIKNSRYKENGVLKAKTYKEQAKALEVAGYSTAEDEFGNKTYAKMLCELIRQYNLQLIDTEINTHNTQAMSL